MQQNQPQSKTEEDVNALTHLVGSSIFLYLAITSSAIEHAAYTLIFSVMFFSSFLYHIETPWKSLFRMVDQFFIYIVIGASGIIVPDLLTPFQKVLFLSVLGLSFVYHIVRQFLKIPEGFTIPFLYLGNGIICSYFLIAMSSQITLSLALGIGTYLFGFVFYIKDDKKYFHSIWHIMCTLGAYFIYVHLSTLF